MPLAVKSSAGSSLGQAATSSRKVDCRVSKALEPVDAVGGQAFSAIGHAEVGELVGPVGTVDHRTRRRPGAPPVRLPDEVGHLVLRAQRVGRALADHERRPPGVGSEDPVALAGRERVVPVRAGDPRIELGGRDQPELVTHGVVVGDDRRGAERVTGRPGRRRCPAGCAGRRRRAAGPRCRGGPALSSARELGVGEGAGVVEVQRVVVGAPAT